MKTKKTTTLEVNYNYLTLLENKEHIYLEGKTNPLSNEDILYINTIIYLINTGIKSTTYFKDKEEWTSIPSLTLETLVSKRYKRVITLLEDHNIIKSLKSTKGTLSYSTDNKQCARYSLVQDKLITTDIEHYFIERSYYKVLLNSIKFILDNKDARKIIEEVSIEKQIDKPFKKWIIVDSDSGRVHHTLIPYYKSILNHFDLLVFDCNASHPRLLLKVIKNYLHTDEKTSLKMTDKLIDELIIYQNYLLTGDIYTNILNDSGLKFTRNEVKEQFMFWVNSANNLNKQNRYLYNTSVWCKIFPEITAFIYNYKEIKGYTSLGQKLRQLERSIWIDTIFDKFCEAYDLQAIIFSVHDSIVIERKYYNLLVDYVKSNYNDLYEELQLDISALRGQIDPFLKENNLTFKEE
jgi:hypothetical protein